MVKTTSDGTSEWEIINGGFSVDTGYCVIQTNNGGYVLAGLFFEIILWSIITGGVLSIVELIPIAFTGAIFSGPIIGIGLTAIVAFPFILTFSWRRLLSVSIILAFAVGLTLYYLLLSQGASPIPQWGTLPQTSPLNPFLTGGFSILKCLPMILIGAVVGKLVLKVHRTN